MSLPCSYRVYNGIVRIVQNTYKNEALIEIRLIGKECV